MKELWKDVPIDGYEGYKVSNTGKVIGVRCGKELRPRNNMKGKGYFSVALYKNNKPKKFYIHRLVALAFKENPSNKTEVNHLDGNPQNNHIDNLEWVTKQENTKHAVDKGLYRNKYKLWDNKEKIQRLLDNGLNYEDIGEYFGCHPAYINEFAIKAELDLPYKRRKRFTNKDSREIYSLFLRRMDNKEIAEKMNSTTKSIENHLRKNYGIKRIKKIS